MQRHLSKLSLERVLAAVAIVTVIVLAQGMLTSVTADPDILEAGIDTWATPNNQTTYIDVDFPAGFFCGGTSAAFSKRIYLKGQPLVTDPAGALDDADTIIERTEDAEFVDGVATTGIKVVALNLVGRTTLLVTCPNSTVECWQVTVRTNGDQEEGTLVVDKTHTNGGTFDSVLSVDGRIDFKSCNTNATAGPITDEIQLTSTNSPWVHTPGSSGTVCPDPVDVDVDGDGTPDTTLPGTSNFHPGWSPTPVTGCAVPPCKVPVEHDGPHGVVFPSCSPTCVVIVTTPGNGTGTGTGAGSGTPTTPTPNPNGPLDPDSDTEDTETSEQDTETSSSKLGN